MRFLVSVLALAYVCSVAVKVAGKTHRTLPEKMMAKKDHDNEKPSIVQPTAPYEPKTVKASYSSSSSSSSKSNMKTMKKHHMAKKMSSSKDETMKMKKKHMMGKGMKGASMSGKGTGKGKDYDDIPEPARRCGCEGCESTAWNSLVNEKDTCGDLITYLQRKKGGLSEFKACASVSNMYPTICGPSCNPGLCGVDTKTVSPTPLPTHPPTSFPKGGGKPVLGTVAPTPYPTAPLSSSPSDFSIPPSFVPSEQPSDMSISCGCELCTDEVLDTEAGGFSCRERIVYLIREDNFTVASSCSFIASEFPDYCGACDPACAGPTPVPTPLPTTAHIDDASAAPTTSTDSSPAPSALPTIVVTDPPTPFPSSSPTPAPSPAPSPAPTSLPTPLDTTPVVEDFSCGCPDCTQDVLELDADGISCGNRIVFSTTPDGGGFTETEACVLVSTSFPDTCGPNCNPNLCNQSGGGDVDDELDSSCGCDACTEEILNRDAEGLSCAVRIEFFQSADGGGLTELEACSVVANDFPDTCGSCNPCRRRRRR